MGKVSTAEGWQADASEMMSGRQVQRAGRPGLYTQRVGACGQLLLPRYAYGGLEEGRMGT